MQFTIPPRDLSEFNGLNQGPREKVRVLLRAMERLHGLVERDGMTLAKALQVVDCGGGNLSAGNLKRHWLAYRNSKGNWRVLLDARYGTTPAASRELKAWAQALVVENKRKVRPAWKKALRELVAGERIPGLGTWKDCWRRENPGEVPPETCPYSEIGKQPKRLSETNFRLLAKMTKEVRAMGKSGTAAARMELSLLVGFDTTMMKPLELVAFDDVRTDFLVLDPLTGQVVELWLLVAMCVGTRCIISFGVRPRRKRADGTHEGITRRDMQHLVVGILQRYGIPSTYPMRLLVENASAAITEGFEAALLEASGGRVLVQRTSMLGGNPFKDGWGEEKKGNPHAKPWIESAFNLMHNEGAGIKGHIGANYSLKSQSVAPAIRYAEKAAKAGRVVMHLAERRLAGLPFEDLQDALHDCQDIFDRMNARRGHSLEGFDKLAEWRWKTAVQWLPWEAAPKGLPAEAWEQIETRKVPESPWMRLTRQVQGLTFDALPASAVPALLLDCKTVTYHGGGVIGWKEQGKLWRFDIVNYVGAGGKVAEGDVVNAWYDSNHPEKGAHLTTGKGSFIGHAERTMMMSPVDRDSMIAAAKHKQKVFAERLEEFQGVALDEAVLQARIDDAERNLETLDLARAALPAPVREAGENAVAAVSTATRRRAATEAAAAEEVDPGIFVRSGRRNRLNVPTDPRCSASS